MRYDEQNPGEMIETKAESQVTSVHSEIIIIVPVTALYTSRL